MGTHIVIDGTAFYEVDDDCLREQKEKKNRRALAGNDRSGIRNGGSGNRPFTGYAETGKDGWTGGEERNCRGRRLRENQGNRGN